MNSTRKPSQEPESSPEHAEMSRATLPRRSIDDSVPSEARSSVRAPEPERTVKDVAKPDDAATADQAPISEEQIRWRAYELYLARGEAPGDALDDWLRAEREFRDRPRK